MVDSSANSNSLDETDLTIPLVLRVYIEREHKYLVCDVKGIVVRCETDICLLLAIRSMRRIVSTHVAFQNMLTYRMRVLTFAAWTSYNFLTASLI